MTLVSSTSEIWTIYNSIVVLCLILYFPLILIPKSMLSHVIHFVVFHQIWRWHLWIQISPQKLCSTHSTFTNNSSNNNDSSTWLTCKNSFQFTIFIILYLYALHNCMYKTNNNFLYHNIARIPLTPVQSPIHALQLHKKRPCFRMLSSANPYFQVQTSPSPG
jgi:hypothetical protein